MGKAIFVQHRVIDVGVPTGKYSDARPVNIGHHFVVLNPYYAFTYEPNGRVELSVRVHYLWNSINHDPFVGFGIKDIQAGQAFHANYAVSYQALENVRLGFNGYWLQQAQKESDKIIRGTSMPGASHRFYFVGKVPLPFFVLCCLLFVNTFLMLLLEFAGKYFLPKTAVGGLHWYQENSITIQFVLLALMLAVIVIFRKRVRWNGQK